ncbi:MAG: CoA transferase, partial [Rhodospirillales bacterium]|nr:CoA transferase [Rhodospirillales bacterium]
LVAEIAALTGTRPGAWWLEALEAADVPCGPINDIAQVFADPQVQARGLKIDLPHPTAGSVPGVACPIRLSETPVEYQRPPPVLGQHTAEVLLGLGLDEANLARLRERGMI